MKHEDIQNQLSAYMDGELTDEARSEVESHLSWCDACVLMLAQLRGVSATIQRLGTVQFGESFKDRVQAEIRALDRRRVERFAGMLSGLAACLAIVAGVQLMRTSSAQASSIAVPAAWEGAALQLNPMDESSATNSSDTTLANWMVADLSQGHSSHE